MACVVLRWRPDARDQTPAYVLLGTRQAAALDAVRRGAG